MKTKSIIHQLVIAAVSASTAFGGTFSFDTTIATNYPGAGDAIIAAVKTSSLLYVASVYNVYKYNISTRVWTTLLPDGSAVQGICLSPIDSYLYVAGHVLFDDANYYSLIRYNPSTQVWTHIGGNLDPDKYADIQAITVASDGYLYIGHKGFPLTLPNTASSYGVARFNLLSGNPDDSTQWDNMGGGVDTGSPSLCGSEVGVYSLGATRITYYTNSVPYYHNRIIIGGEFQKTVSGVTNHNIVMWEDIRLSSSGGTLVSTNWSSLKSPASYYGVALCEPDGYLLIDNGCFVNRIAPVTGNWIGCNEVIVGGYFEIPDSTTSSQNFNGLAKVNTDSLVISGWGWPFASAACPPGDHLRSSASAVSVCGTNTYAGGAMGSPWNVIGPNGSGHCLTPPDYGYALWARLGSGQQFVDSGDPFYGSIYAMTSDSSSTGTVYIGGDFTAYGSTAVNQLVAYKYNPE